eukprot:TRINITY_DN466_c0_g1_i1.p1 TRINITY_DN466_c0_g1~~TRINITY_DN466_c0_g1_i1.p1  ORF type:complete len:559 (+),score=286.28 TRINITY_DN466_c0_g1_i1:57-1733(+)
MSFDLPSTFDNPTGWGPPKNDQGLPFDIPYQPFIKGDRIGQLLYSTKGRGGGGRGKVGFYDLPVDDEEKTWTTADYNKPQSRGRSFRARGRWGNQGRGGGVQRGHRGGPGGRGQMGTKPKLRKDQNGGFGFRGRRDVHRSASIEVKADWNNVATLPLSDLSKLNEKPPMNGPSNIQTIAEEGEALFWNPFFDKLGPSQPLDVVQMQRSLEDSSVVESKKIREIAGKMMKEAGAGDVQVYATDAVLATLMAAPKSSVAWDISIERFGNAYFLNWRKGTAVDMWTVNETAQDQPLMEEPTQASATEEQKLNIQPKLMKELTGLTMNLSQQVLDRKKAVTGKSAVAKAPVPEACEANNTKPASVVYRYRSWDLPHKDGEPSIKVVARTHADGYLERPRSYFRTFAFLDLSAQTFRPGLMRKEEGAITAPEIINNGTRLAKQAVVAHLAGCDKVKMAYVARKKADRSQSHSILHFTQYELRDLVKHTGMSFKGMWNILTKIINEVVRCKNDEMQQKFVLMKDPNKPLLKLYDIGEGGAEESDDDSDEEEEEEEDESDSEESK